MPIGAESVTFSGLGCKGCNPVTGCNYEYLQLIAGQLGLRVAPRKVDIGVRVARRPASRFANVELGGRRPSRPDGPRILRFVVVSRL